MRQKRTLILLAILLVVAVGAGGAFLMMGGHEEVTTTKISVEKIRKKTPVVVKKRATKPSPKDHCAVKIPTGKGTLSIFQMFPIDPGENYIAGAVDVKAFQGRMGKRLSAKDRATLERMSLDKCGYTMWPKGIQDQFHYAVICSLHGDPSVVKKELVKGKNAIEGTCGKSIRCLQITNKKGNASYLAFKGKRFMVFSDVASLAASIVTTSPNKARGQRWARLLPVKKGSFGVFLASFTNNEKGGTVSDFTPSNLGKRSNVTIAKVMIHGDFEFIPRGMEFGIRIALKNEKNQAVDIARVPGRVEALNPSLPADALMAGIDLNAARKSIEATTARYKGKTDPELQRIEGRLFFELSFGNGRPLVHLKMVDMKENGPNLKKLGKPGDQVDITTMINPFLAMFLGKTTFKRIKGGFVATNLVGNNLAPSKEGIEKSKKLFKGLNVKHPLALVSLSPSRFLAGAIALAQPFVSRNPEIKKRLDDLNRGLSDNTKPRPERIVLIARSLTDYQVRVEYNR